MANQVITFILAMSTHMFSTNPENTLTRATTICRQYGIYHSTIQVEHWNNKKDIDLC